MNKLQAEQELFFNFLVCSFFFWFDLLSDCFQYSEHFKNNPSACGFLGYTVVFLLFMLFIKHAMSYNKVHHSFLFSEILGVGNLGAVYMEGGRSWR